MLWHRKAGWNRRKRDVSNNMDMEKKLVGLGVEVNRFGQDSNLVAEEGFLRL